MSSRKYYTNVFRMGNRLFVREIRDGKRREFKTEYKPTLYVPSKAVSTLHAPDGTYVKAMQPGNMSDCYQFMQSYKDVDNFRIYGNTAYEYAFLNEEYPGTIEYNPGSLVVANLDIEVAKTENGYSEARDAYNEIISITAKTSKDGVFHAWACKAFDVQAYAASNPDIELIYHHCNDEIDLLEKFLDWWETVRPDIAIGWNCKLYDFPYMINRISRVLSQDHAKRLSVWGVIKESTVDIFGEPEVVYEIAGLAILDYMILYRKNVLEPRESYRLDYIAEVELGENKVDYGEYGDLQTLYEQNFQKFIEYNCQDVRLVDRIDAKRKLVELQIIVAYHAKVNFVDVLSQVRTWDTLICNYLLDHGMVVPQKTSVVKDTQFSGGFVMKPIIGMHEWVASFDVQSLYPTIMRSLNMGMESKLDAKDLTPEMRKYANWLNANLMIDDENGKPIVNPDSITNGLTPELIKHLYEHDVAVAANGIFYRREPKSFYSIMIESLFTSRLEYKNKMKSAATELSTCKDPIRISELETIKSIFDLKQHSTKIMLNSLYGALGNQYFRFFDVKNAEAVTLTGQFLIQYVGRALDKYLNRTLKTVDQRYVIYSDTDSVYVTLKGAVDKYYPQGTVMEKVEFVDKICKEALQPEINRVFRLLTDRYMNGVGEYLLMNREIIGDKGIWTAKKRYLINVRDKEGIRKDKAEIKVMGLEISKASVPKFCRTAMKEAVRIVMEESQEVLYKFMADTKIKFKAQSIENVSFPRGVNGLAKYGHKDTLYIKGTPGHTKAALAYNYMLEKTGMTNKYAKIKDGEKMKFFFIYEPNPVGVNAMAFLTVLPPEFDMHNLIDWETQYQKSLIEPLMLILDAIKWDTQRRANLDGLFELT